MEGVKRKNSHVLRFVCRLKNPSGQNQSGVPHNGVPDNNIMVL